MSDESRYNDLLLPAIEYYTGEKISVLYRNPVYSSFVTDDGKEGIIVNDSGDGWDIYIENEHLEKMNEYVYELCKIENQNLPLDDLCDKCKKLINDEFIDEKGRSFLIFFYAYIVNYILKTKVKLSKPIKIGYLFLYQLKEKRLELNLN